MVIADRAQKFSRIQLSLVLRAGRVASDSLKQPQRPDLEVYVAAR